MSDGKAQEALGSGPHEIADVAARLLAVVQAVEGRNVGTNGDELWFESAREPGVQLRLSEPGQARCYDRSANFSISYRGPAANGGDARLVRALVERVKQIDATSIGGASVAFRAAAESVAGRCAEAPPAGAWPDWERDGTRRLNVVFLDLCARLFGTPGDPLAPLHWGYWPSGQAVTEGGVADDPLRAFSDMLLAHVPDGTERILDIGCGLGFNARLLSTKGYRVTAVSPVAHHCALIESAGLPGVEVRCVRFDELTADQPHDLLLFSESLNHFPLDDNFFHHCRSFLSDRGHMLMADDLTKERVQRIESQRVFRIRRTVDITDNVAPTTEIWQRQLPVVAAYHAALMSILELSDEALAERVREVLGQVDNPELRLLLSGQLTPPRPKGRYMIYLLAPAG
ncbi:MAG TPA: class I SAM-dependent methyltransferase [Candidatus Dormibacteraeota bacterium]|nr:class I SAM-dependent methyltransferase [Candidatus Dormibacteraeota bacterium]